MCGFVTFVNFKSKNLEEDNFLKLKAIYKHRGPDDIRLEKNQNNLNIEIKELKKFHPAGKIAKPGEISKLVIFLCTNNNGFITGSEISIDGGIGSRLHDPI